MSNGTKTNNKKFKKDVAFAALFMTSMTLVAGIVLSCPPKQVTVETFNEEPANFEGEDADLNAFDEAGTIHIIATPEGTISFSGDEEPDSWEDEEPAVAVQPEADPWKTGSVRFHNIATSALDDGEGNTNGMYSADTLMSYEELLAYENPFADISSEFYKNKLREEKGDKYVALYNSLVMYVAEGYKCFSYDAEFYGIDIDTLRDIFNCVAGDIPLVESSKSTWGNSLNSRKYFYSSHIAEKPQQLWQAYDKIKAEAEMFKGLEGLELAAAVNQYVVDKLEYDLEYINEIRFKESELYHAAEYGKAVCDGYASYFQALILAASDDYECFTVASDSSEENPGHEYALMDMDNEGEFYAFDPTASDSADSNLYLATSTDRISNPTPSASIAEFVPEIVDTKMDISFKWDALQINKSFTYSFMGNTRLLEYARNTCYAEDYGAYTQDAISSGIIKNVVNNLRRYADENNFTEQEFQYMLISFVQNMELEENGGDVKMPFETMFDGKGSRLDTALLLASMLHEAGFSAGVIFSDDYVLTVLHTEIPKEGRGYIQLDGKCFFMIDTASKDSEIGVVDFERVDDTVTTIYFS